MCSPVKWIHRFCCGWDFHAGCQDLLEVSPWICLLLVSLIHVCSLTTALTIFPVCLPCRIVHPCAQPISLWLCPFVAAAAAKSLQSCPTLCDTINGSPPGSPIPGILQARTLEWVAISFSNAWKWKVKVKLLSRVRLFETQWTAAYQTPPSIGVSRQEYWSGLPFPSVGNLPDPGIKPTSLVSPALAG